MVFKKKAARMPNGKSQSVITPRQNPSKKLSTKLRASSKFWTCQPLRYTSKCSNSVFIYEPPTLVLRLTKQKRKKKKVSQLHFSPSCLGLACWKSILWDRCIDRSAVDGGCARLASCTGKITGEWDWVGCFLHFSHLTMRCKCGTTAVGVAQWGLVVRCSGRASQACFYWNNAYIYIIWLGSGLLFFNESHTRRSMSVGSHSRAGNC